MKNKKIVVIITSMILLIGGILFANNVYQNKYKINKTNRKKQNNLAIMIKEDGASEYIKSSSKDIPTGNYTLNYEKSYCKNNGVIGDYDSTLGKVSFSFIGTDSCYLYFDYKDNSIDIATLMIANNTDIFEENGIRYEGTDPNNYICLDNQKEGSCSNSTLLFRIIGLFDEEYSNNGSSSTGTKKLLKVIDTNNFGGTNGKMWNSSGTNNWGSASLKTELNKTYLNTLTTTSNVNDKLEGAIINAKWHLGGAMSSNYKTITTEGIYTQERNTSAIYGGNPSSIYAKVGLMYSSDYGYATDGNGLSSSKSLCRTQTLSNWSSSSFSYCSESDWLFTSQKISWGSNKEEWLLSPYSSDQINVAYLDSLGYVNLDGTDVTDGYLFAIRPTFYLDASILKVVGGTGTSIDPYHIG